MINLNDLKSPYIDLNNYPQARVKFTGAYNGPRLVLKNACNKIVHFYNCVIESDHAEDAICFDGEVEGLVLTAEGTTLNGAITFWDRLDDVLIRGFVIDGPHTGIRATQDKPHKNIVVTGNTIRNVRHEGIYLGPSHENKETTGSNYTISDNIIEKCLWDGIQVGNVYNCRIFNNLIDGVGLSHTWGQSYGITINPGSQAYVYGNKFVNCRDGMQVLDSRCFIS